MPGPKISKLIIVQMIRLALLACRLPIIHPGAISLLGKWHSKTQPSTWCKEKKNILPLLRSKVVMLTILLKALSEMDRGQHGHWLVCSYIASYTASWYVLCVLTNFCHSQQLFQQFVLKWLFYDIEPDGLDFAPHMPWAPLTLSLVLWLSFHGSLLIGAKHCIVGKPHKTCHLGDVLTQSSHPQSNTLNFSQFTKCLLHNVFGLSLLKCA